MTMQTRMNVFVDTVNNCVTTHQEVINVIVTMVSHWTPTTEAVQVRE